MTPTQQFVERLQVLQEGERSKLRRLADKGLDESLPGFDLFTGIWWTLRQKHEKTPRRSIAWLAAKLIGSFSIPTHDEGPRLAGLLGALEPRSSPERYQARVDTLLCTPLDNLEPHLRWALSLVEDAHKRGALDGLNWARLIDDLSAWDRGPIIHSRDVRDIWAEDYLAAAMTAGRRS